MSLREENSFKYGSEGKLNNQDRLNIPEFSYKMSVVVKSLSHVEIFCNPWTLLSMGFSSQQCWSGLPLLTPRDLPHPGIEPALSALTGGFFTNAPPGEP